MSARDLHAAEEQARESGQLAKALELADQALLAYQQENNIPGMAEIQATRFIIFKHLYQQTGVKAYLILGKSSAQAGVEIASQSGERQALGIPLFNLAKAHAEAEEWEQAVEVYRQAVQALTEHPDKDHDRPAVLLDVKHHLHTAEYMAGDKSALERAEQVAAELAQTEELDDYNKHVWQSGAYMRLAAISTAEQPEKARQYLKQAKGIIDKDQRLTLRLGQWQKLVKQLGLDV